MVASVEDHYVLTILCGVGGVVNIVSKQIQRIQVRWTVRFDENLESIGGIGLTMS